MDTIFDKTDKGREEIATRKDKLPARLRSLLLLVDGKHEVNTVLKQVSGLGLTSQHIVELLENGFIEGVLSPHRASDDDEPEITATAISEARPAAAVATTPEGQIPSLAIYNFYTHSISKTLGLRGYLLQLKVERAGSVADFRALRAQFIEAVYRAKGSATARTMRDQLDRLLDPGAKPKSKIKSHISVRPAPDSVVSA